MNERTAVITGANSGFGRLTAQAFAADGWRVYATMRNTTTKNARAAADLRNAGISVVDLDVTDDASVDAAAKAILAEAGGGDVLVNNAGITRDGLVLRMKRADWDDVLATNLTGAFLLTQALLSAMLRNRWGRIINISSVVGRTGQAGQVNYAATKAGLIGMTRSLAREVASRGVTVNAVAPGYIETPMTAVLDEKQTAAMIAQIPLGRAGTDADIAQAVVYLASEGAGYVTGHVLDVNGGMYMGG